MANQDTAMEIAQRFVEMENKIRALEAVIKRYWPHPGSPWETFVQKGYEQLRDHETTAQRLAELQSAFDACNDDDSLFRTLRQETLWRVKIE